MLYEISIQCMTITAELHQCLNLALDALMEVSFPASTAASTACSVLLLSRCLSCERCRTWPALDCGTKETAAHSLCADTIRQSACSSLARRASASAHPNDNPKLHRQGGGAAGAPAHPGGPARPQNLPLTLNSPPHPVAQDCAPAAQARL